ncbi:hypothetical protein E5288_WYG007995 [Bos mutus]|uniref:Uncharacterized protein n=1 Tax=Bos mutus TaxID=72004 RepID=A0A6B0QY82_9CETA|nr:hypothetical protein [Bos mutus]
MEEQLPDMDVEGRMSCGGGRRSSRLWSVPAAQQSQSPGPRAPGARALRAAPWAQTTCRVGGARRLSREKLHGLRTV